MTRQPGQHFGMLVGGIVVEDDMDRPTGYDLALDSIEKANEFEIAVALHAAADHCAVEHAERGEQGGGWRIEVRQLAALLGSLSLHARGDKNSPSYWQL